jgi:hypothetical protein
VADALQGTSHGATIEAKKYQIVGWILSFRAASSIHNVGLMKETTERTLPVALGDDRSRGALGVRGGTRQRRY